MPALRSGSLQTLFTNANVFGFARVAAPNKPVIVALNKASQPVAVDVPVRGLYPDGARLADRKSSFQAQVSGGKIHVQLFPRDGVILAGTP